MTDALVHEAGPLKGRLRLPGDKSISHRAAMFAALARGWTEIRNFSPGLDCRSTLSCLAGLGVAVEPLGEDGFRIEGRGPEALSEPDRVLDAGNSGTTMRLLTGLLAGLPLFSVLTGDDSLRQRPMGRVAEPLRRMGARIDGRKQGTLAPLAIRGGGLTAFDHLLPVASAQVKSALILAGLFAEGETAVTEPAASRDHTERMLLAMGAPLRREGRTCRIQGTRPEALTLTARPLRIPADISAAAFFLAAGLLVPGSDLLVEEVGVNPTRTGMLEALEAMGATVEIRFRDEEAYGGEPVADLRVQAGVQLQATVIRGEMIPRLIDEIPILAVLATQAAGCTEIRDAGELRVKETDRIAALAALLHALDADVEELPDGLRIQGPCRLKGNVVDSRGDHRIAMAAAVAGLAAEGATRVHGAECVAISDPSFFANLTRLGVQLQLDDGTEAP